MIRPWFLILALVMFLTVVLAVNAYHYAAAVFGSIPS